MLGWCGATVAIVLILLTYVAFFWKMNWIRDLRSKDTKFMRPTVRKCGKVPPVYPNGWFALLETRQLEKGQVKHVAALGENFAVFRTEKGVVNILDAYCPHLGANMGEGGSVKGDCLECPFHMWQFRGSDGQCATIPYAEKVPHFAKVKSWRCCEVNNFIFVWYHSESMEPNWEPPEQAFVTNGTWRYQGRNEFLVGCHIQDIAENGADVAHLNAVHGPPMIFTGSSSWLARHSWTEAVWSPPVSPNADSNDESQDLSNGTVQVQREYGKGSNIQKAPGKRDHVASMHLRHSVVLLKRFMILKLNVKVQQIGPGYVEMMIHSALGPMCVLQTVTPVEPLVQRVTHLMFSPPLLAPYASLILLGECLMFERDVAIWNHKRFEQQPMLVKEDRAIVAYRRWYSQFYSANSPTHEMAMKTLQW